MKKLLARAAIDLALDDLTRDKALEDGAEER